MATFNKIVSGVTQLNSQLGDDSSLSRCANKWYVHEDRAAQMVGATETVDTTGAAILGEFVNCLKNGGSGSKRGGSFVPNPSPYDKTKINIFDNTSNPLNFHATKHKSHGCIPCADNAPSPDAVLRNAVYYRFGEGKLKVNLTRQLELVRYVTGVDGYLQHHYRSIATERQQLWLQWATDDPAGAAFNNKDYHLPVIALHFRDLWDHIGIGEEVELKDITPTQLSAVKREIIDALIASYVLDPSLVNLSSSRRSDRIRGNEAGPVDVVLTAVPDKESKRKRQEADQQANQHLVETVSDNDDDQCSSERDGTFDIDVALGTLRQLELERVGVLEVAYTCAHARVDYPTVTRKLFDLNQGPIAEEEYKCILRQDKSTLKRRMMNFEKIKEEINEKQLLKVKEGQLLLDYLNTIAQINNGSKLPMKLCDNQGHLKPEKAYILRDILYSHPRIGLKNMIELYVCFHVLMTGEVPEMPSYPSTATLRCHIAMLNSIDNHQRGEHITRSLTSLSPLGSKRYFAIVSDDTKQGKKEHRHGLIIASDRDIPTEGQQQSGGLATWFVRPQFHVLANDDTTTKSSDGNSDYNHQCLAARNNISLQALAQVTGHATDNAPDARLEAKKTFDSNQQFLRNKGMRDDTYSFGVKTKLVHLGDSLHVGALCCKHGSLGACGDTTNGKFDQWHHRQSIQNLWDILVRDPITLKALFIKILGEELVEEVGLPSILREQDARWLSNGYSSDELLKYVYIVDEEGNNFWVLFCREAQHLYPASDFRRDRLAQEEIMFSSPTIIASLHFEAEVTTEFEVTHQFHAERGQLADRPGFRSLELSAFYLDYVLPFWEAAKRDPASKFPNTYAYLDTIADPELRELKRQQIEKGINDAHAEVAKMAEQYLVGPWLLILIAHPVHGSDVARAVFQVAKEEDISYYLNPELKVDWSFFDNDEELSATAKVFLDQARKHKEETLQFLQQFGLMTVETRDESIKLTREKPNCRDAESSTWLLDFANEYPRLFDRLHAQLALFPSNTRIVEQMHGVGRASHDTQASHESATSRYNHVMSVLYQDRLERRELSRQETHTSSTSTSTSASKSKRRRVGTKHNDRKYLIDMLGQQLIHRASSWTTEELTKRVPHQVLNDNRPSRIKQRGTDRTRKQLCKDKVAHAQKVYKNNVRKGFRPTEREDVQLRALQLRTDHDLSWNTREQTELYNKLRRLSLKSYWRSIKKDDLYTEIEKVLPKFWHSSMKSMTKKALLDTNTTKDDNVFLFFEHIQKIAKREIEDDISDTSRLEELQNLSEEEYLLEFVKVEQSVHLAAIATQQANKMAAMYNLMEEIAKNGSQQPYDRDFEHREYTIRTISYCEGDFKYGSDDEDEEDDD